MSTDYRAKYNAVLEPLVNGLVPSTPEPDAEGGHSGDRVGGMRQSSKSLPSTPSRHKAGSRVKFYTEFPDHCKVFEGHMKVD